MTFKPKPLSFIDHACLGRCAPRGGVDNDKVGSRLMDVQMTDGRPISPAICASNKHPILAIEVERSNFNLEGRYVTLNVVTIRAFGRGNAIGCQIPLGIDELSPELPNIDLSRGRRFARNRLEKRVLGSFIRLFLTGERIILRLSLRQHLQHLSPGFDEIWIGEQSVEAGEIVAV